MTITYDPPLTGEEVRRFMDTYEPDFIRLAARFKAEDVVIRVPAEPEISAPAWYMPTTRAITINREVIDLRHATRPTILGVVTHELGHHYISRWAYPDGINDAVRNILTVLEEIRVEVAAHNLLKDNTNLRAMFLWLLSTMSTDWQTPFGLSELWALVVGRHHAGVCSWDEVSMIDAITRAELGDDTVDTMKELLTYAMVYRLSDPKDPTPLVEVATEWVTMFMDPDASDDSLSGMGDSEGGEPQEGENGDPDPGAKCGHSRKAETVKVKDEPGEVTPGSGSSGDTDKSDDTEDGEGDKAPTETISVGFGEVGSHSGDVDEPDDVTPMPELSSDTKDMIKDALSKLAETVKDLKTLPAPLDLADPITQVKAMMKRAKRISHSKIARPVPPDVRLEARRFATTLENLALPVVAKNRTATELPPGKLNGREMIRRAADRDAGRMSSARPWRGVKRERTIRKPLIVGAMTDTSGSMSWAMTVVAEFAWAVTVAGTHVGARTAAVTYGDTVDPVVLPMSNPQELMVYPANGGIEAFDKAAAGLDGLLKLRSQRDAAKIVFNFSDGHYVVDRESERALEWIRQWTDNDVRVVWVGCEHSWTRRQLEHNPNVIFVEAKTELAPLLRLLEKELRKI